MGIVEWLAAHALSPVLNAVRTIRNKPRPELKIRDLEPTGGGSTVTFKLSLQNVGTKPGRYSVSARVGGTAVDVSNSPVDLLTNTPPSVLEIRVPRSAIGDLIKEFNSDTTLYGEELVVEVTDTDRSPATGWRKPLDWLGRMADGSRFQRKTWREHVYTAEENSERERIQQRVWSRGRGEDVAREPLRDYGTQLDDALREDLVAWALERAAELNHAVPVRVEGSNPAVVTYHPSGTKYIYPDHPSYLAGMEAREVNPLLAGKGEPPRVVSAWPDNELRAWLRERADRQTEKPSD